MPTVHTRLLVVLAADLAELRIEAGLELHQRRARMGTVHDRAEGHSAAGRRGRLQTINYGGGARWFINEHVAVSLDLRFYAINPQEATLTRPAFPRVTIMAFNAGVGMK